MRERMLGLLAVGAFVGSLDTASPQTLETPLVANTRTRQIDRRDRKLLTLGRSVIISYTNRERRRLEPYVDRYCPHDSRAFCPFFGLNGFGFTIARLTPP